MNTTFKFRRRIAQQRGFSLIEAMIALLVMAFGMLALSGMQLSLSRNSDVAKQRNEAMRIAQERIEQARSYTSLAAAAGIDWTNLVADVAAPATVTTNTTYTVAVAAGGVVNDAARAIQVTTTWTDRVGDSQIVTLSTVVARNDPKDPGFNANPLPLNTALKRPKNRNINIPIPALDLGAGQSSTPFDANYAIVYSNLTGAVIKICSSLNLTGLTDAQKIAAINTAIAGGSCTAVTGYIVAGYIGRTGGSITWPTGINHSAVSRNTPHATEGIRCLFSDATDQNTNVTITADNGYKYYVCVVPLAAPNLWGGTVRLGGVPTTGNYIVCRYQYTQTNITVNERNIQPYVDVGLSMDEQNYLVTTSAAGTCPAAMTVTGVSVGTLHQDCRTSNAANHATVCPAPS